MRNQMSDRISVEFATIKKVRSQLRLLLMTENIFPTKNGQKDIKYLREKIARMKREMNIRYG